MHFLHLLIAIFLQALCVSAIPRLEEDASTSSRVGYSNHTVYTTIYNSTITVSVAHTTRTAEPNSSAEPTSGSVSDSNATSTASSSQSRPTLPFGVVAIRSGSPIHFLPVNAAGQRFWLGGQPVSYCPSTVEEVGGCPPGDATAFGLCKMDVLVPGGQEIFALPNGELGYTKAHSVLRPSGSTTCPFEYTTDEASNWEGFGHLSANATNAFGAHGLQACPTHDGRYQVLLDLSNATVSNVTRTGCLPFVALAVDYTQGYAAWQYN